MLRLNMLLPCLCIFVHVFLRLVFSSALGTQDYLYPYGSVEGWGSHMGIADIRRRLNEVDQNSGAEPINNTFNSIDIAGGEDTDDLGDSADITIKNVGRVLPKPINSLPGLASVLYQWSICNGKKPTEAGIRSSPHAGLWNSQQSVENIT